VSAADIDFALGVARDVVRAREHAA
jgi:hypothetical protein